MFLLIVITMSKTYFISGHLELSEQEFDEHYKSKIDKALAEKASFVVGDAPGTDLMAQKYLLGKTDDVTVYHMRKTPRNDMGFFLRGKFKNDTDKDTAMTNASDKDIAWVRSEEEQKKLFGDKYRKRVSGTEKNLWRRRSLKKNPGRR